MKSINVANELYESGTVNYAYPNWLRTRSKRAIPDDPLFSDQWHLENVGQGGGTPGEDVDITTLWDTYRGSGNEVIAIVDDGLEITHEDLSANIITDRCWDYVDGDMDPGPGTDDIHGTACAGVAAGRGFNGSGISGAAPEAGLVGYRLLGATTDQNEAEALSLYSDEIDIYSNSWGPYDLPHLEGPGPLVEDAFESAAENGRSGLGSIFVWAGGNGKDDGDNSNFDGYANNRYTIAVAASNDFGMQPFYSENGANILINAPSNGGQRGITTTDIMGPEGYDESNYTDSFGGTSSATPLVSGIIALMLEANPNLNWRDVQHILLETAEQNDPTDSDWTVNSAGYDINHKYGFGRINAYRAVNEAISWISADTEVSVQGSSGPGLPIPDSDSTGITDTINIPEDINIESVEISFSASDHTWWGDLEITLTSPAGTTSVLAEPNYDVGANTPYNNWRFISVRHFGESSQGAWNLNVKDSYSNDTGTFQTWTVKIYGTNIEAGDKLQFSDSVFAANENDGSINVPVLRAGPGSGVVSVDYTTYGVNATVGSDYVETIGTLTFNDGEMEKMITIYILDDDSIFEGEEDETVKLRLSNPGGEAILGNPRRATLIISEDEPPQGHVVDSNFDGVRLVSTADVDGDGDMDIIGAAGTADDITWWENMDGFGTSWSQHTIDSYFEGAYSVYAADVDRDGDMDILGAGYWADDITWWENINGAGTSWSEHTINDEFDGARSVYAADVDGDGDIDVLGAGFMVDDIRWWENIDGGGTSWAEHTIDIEFDGAHSVYAADVDGDGDIDVCGAAYFTDDLVWWENIDGTGTSWNEHTVDYDFDGANFIYAADVDGDGDLDLLGTAEFADDISWYENIDGSGSLWKEHTIDGYFAAAQSVSAVDVDGDGDMDILGAAYTANDITWWENIDGSGAAWIEHIINGNIRGAISICTADINGNGSPDIIGASYLDNQIIWWENPIIILDMDGDGLSDVLEDNGCTDSNDADSDDDGISDGDEDADHDGIVGPDETDPCDLDTDDDGIQDGTESGIIVPVSDPDGDGPLLGTDTSIFQPDIDPGTITDPIDDDYDDDGISDGLEDVNHNGSIDACEPDPGQITFMVEVDLDSDGDVDGDDLSIAAGDFGLYFEAECLPVIAAYLGYTDLPAGPEGD